MVVDPGLKGKPLHQSVVELDDELEPGVRGRYEAACRGTPAPPSVPEMEAELTFSEPIAMIRELARLGFPCGLKVRPSRLFSGPVDYITLAFPGDGSSSHPFPLSQERNLDT